MGDEQGHKAQLELKIEPQIGALHHRKTVEPGGEVRQHLTGKDKEQHHRDAGDDVRVGQGDVVHRQARGAGPAAHGGKAQGRGSAGDGGDDGGQNGHQQRGLEGVQHRPVLEQFQVPVQSETAPYRVGLGVVEGKDDQYEDGSIEEEEHDDQKKSGNKTVLFHRTTASPSPSPKRFMIPMLTRTMTIITREMAEPRWGL